VTSQCWSLLTVGGMPGAIDHAHEMLVEGSDVPLDALGPSRGGRHDERGRDRWGTASLRVLATSTTEREAETATVTWLASSPDAPPARWFVSWLVEASLLGSMSYVQPASQRVGRLDVRVLEPDGEPFGDPVGRLPFWRVEPTDREPFIHNSLLFGYRHEQVGVADGREAATYVHDVIRGGWLAWDNAVWQGLTARRTPDEWRPSARGSGLDMRAELLAAMGLRASR
jgi:hypothetical protein